MLEPQFPHPYNGHNSSLHGFCGGKEVKPMKAAVVTKGYGCGWLVPSRPERRRGCLGMDVFHQHKHLEMRRAASLSLKCLG